MVVKLLGLLLSIIVIFSFIKSIRGLIRKDIKNKHILVIGGTKGVGYELVQILNQSNKVTVIARNMSKRIKGVKYICMDITKEIKPVLDDKYDIILCCAGFCEISKETDTNLTEKAKSAMIENYIGPLNIYNHIKKRNKKEFIFVVCASTSIWFNVAGYLTYAASKSALFTFANQLSNVKIVAMPNVNTEAFKRENLTKPDEAKKIERFGVCLEPSQAAKLILRRIYNRKIIYLDTFTYFLGIKRNCENFVDCLLYPVATIIVGLVKMSMK